LGTGQVCKWETLLAIDHLPLDQITNLPGRMRQFHEERLAAIAAENAAAADTLDDRLGTIVIHILPFSAFALRGHRVSAAQLKTDWVKLQFYGRLSPTDCRVNIDGVLAWAGQEPATTYVQAYRDGIVEVAGRGVAHRDRHRTDRPPIIYSASVETHMVAAVLSNLRYLEKLGFAPRFAILTALLDATGARLDEGHWSGEPPTIDRSPVRFSEVIVETMPVDEQMAAQRLRPLFDELANAGGRTTSRNFAADGSWTARNA
jgi:hypothetical protein